MIENEIQPAGRVLVGGIKAKGKKKKINIDQLKAKDSQLVKGRFSYVEIPGGTLSFVYKAYEGDPVVRYDLKDGEIYKLPLGVARHLNNNVGRNESMFLLDMAGKPSTIACRRIRRCSFESLEFIDIEMNNSQDIGRTRIEEVTAKTVDDLPELTL